MKNLLYIGNKLSSHGITVTSIETLGKLLEREGYNIVYASSKKNKFLRLSEMLWATFHYSKKIDYVLIDTYSTYNFWYAFAVSQLCRILGTKYIPKLHGGDLPNRLHRNPMLCKMIFKYAYKNVAPSDYLMRAFKDRGYAEVVYISNTIEIQNYPFKERKVINPKLLWVRSLSSIYNPEMALSVVERLREKFPEATLCMVGPDKDGKLGKLRQTAHDHQLKVQFTGKLSKTEWIKRSEDYSIFINTTHFDNMPVSVIEAMALGLPVVSTNVGGIPYMLEDRKTAMLVNDNDADAMADAIFEIIGNQQLKEILVSNALVMVNKFDWDLVKGKWHEILI